jgi:hypothetical protein
MGETTVIFAAAVGVLLLLARGPGPRRVLVNGLWTTVAREEEPPELEADEAPATEDDEPKEDDDG